VEAVSGDRGQALIFAALLFGVAAIALLGLRDASLRILDGVRDDRAGEAAAEAGAAAVAHVKDEREHGRQFDKAQTAAFASEPEIIEAAREAALRIVRVHGRADPTDVSVHAFGFEIEVHVTLAGRQHIALLEPAP
jgi:hypothetical protein